MFPIEIVLWVATQIEEEKLRAALEELEIPVRLQFDATANCKKNINRELWIVNMPEQNEKVLNAVSDHLNRYPQQGAIFITPKDPSVPTWASRFLDNEYVGFYATSELDEGFTSYVRTFVQFWQKGQDQ